MVTPDEIAAISLFAALEAGDRERLSRTAADISLAAGEYAVNEGDERALFAVLEGKIEVVKRVDGIERVLGARGPGTIFGEVPITLGGAVPERLPGRRGLANHAPRAPELLHDGRGGARCGGEGRRAGA